MWKGNHDAEEECKDSQMRLDKPKNYSEVNSTHFISIPISLNSVDI